MGIGIRHVGVSFSIGGNDEFIAGLAFEVLPACKIDELKFGRFAAQRA